MKRAFLLAAIIAAGVGFAGCDTDHSRVDAHDVPNSAVDRTPPDVTVFSNHYPNIQTKCVAGAPGFRAFVATHDSSKGRNIIVMEDKSC